MRPGAISAWKLYACSEDTIAGRHRQGVALRIRGCCNSRVMRLKISNAIAALLVIVLAGAWFMIGADETSKANPPASIPTFSTEDIARTGFFYAGGNYVGDKGKEVMGGAMYVEVMVPKRIRRVNPIVFLHGAGQTGTDWLQTPDGR